MKTTKTLASLIAFLAVVPTAYAEQGDAEDRALIEKMSQSVSHDEQSASVHRNTAYDDSEKADTQSRQSVQKENEHTDNQQRAGDSTNQQPW